MANRYTLFHPQTVQSLLDLSNTSRAKCLPLMRGGAPGKLDLIYQLFPPKGVHRNETAVSYTIIVDEYDRAPVTETLKLMVSLVDSNDGSDLVFGFLAHDYLQELSESTGLRLETRFCDAAVQYNSVTREGFAYLHNGIWPLIEKKNARALARLAELREINTK